MAIIRRSERPINRQQQEWDPFQQMESLLRNFDPFRPMAPVWTDERTFMPQFEVKETRDGYLFKADMPGVKEPDLDISVSGNMLTISGRREAEKRDEGDTFYSYERSYGSFSRSFTLPDSADTDQVKAELKDGVLTLHLPKKPELQPRKVQLGARAPDNAKA